MEELKLKKCSICGAIVKVVENNNNSKFICCGKEMEDVIPNSVDASFERHIPEVQVENNEMMIKVDHVMEENHYIEWILVKKEKEIREFFFKPGDVCEVKVPYMGKAIVYSYCNLHGLWKKEVE